MRVIHYLNQFFGGIGGEDKADTSLQFVDGPVGPGRALQMALGERGEVVGTLICGDNYFNENEETVADEAAELMARAKPDVIVAGPAFNAGRYGLACGKVCQVAQEQVNVPAVTAMYPENPGVDMYRSKVYIIPAAATAIGMGNAVERLAGFACKLASGQPLGSAAEEGYLPRGIRRNVRVGVPASQRAAEMLLAKLRGEPFETELRLEVMDKVSPPPPIVDLSKATIAIVTEAGIVPKGNPHRIESGRATRWAKYSIAGLDALPSGEYESAHAGYDSRWVIEDPNRAVPVDALRKLEAEGVIGKLLDCYYVTVGNAGNLQVMRRMAREIAEELRAQGVDAVVVPAT